jgi:transposase-like protein
LIVEYLNRGVSVAEIAARFDIGEKRMRAIIREILARRMPAPPEEFLAIQLSRLNEALLVAYSAMSPTNLKAVDQVVRIVRELDRYHGFAVAGRRRPAPRQIEHRSAALDAARCDSGDSRTVIGGEDPEPTPLLAQVSLRGVVEPVDGRLRGHDELQIPEGRDDPDRFETEPAAARADSNPTAPRDLYARFRRLGDDGEALGRSAAGPPPTDAEGFGRVPEREGATTAFLSRMRERLERSACLGEPDDVDRTARNSRPENSAQCLEKMEFTPGIAVAPEVSAGARAEPPSSDGPLTRGKVSASGAEPDDRPEFRQEPLDILEFAPASSGGAGSGETGFARPRRPASFLSV